MEREQDRNEKIMQWRQEQRYADLKIMYDVNQEWFNRAWDTPDTAVCLGRY